MGYALWKQGKKNIDKWWRRDERRGERKREKKSTNEVERTKEEKQEEPEYYEIVDASTMEEVSDGKWPEKLAICVAGYVGGVRLIDNIIIDKE